MKKIEYSTEHLILSEYWIICVIFWQILLKHKIEYQYQDKVSVSSRQITTQKIVILLNLSLSFSITISSHPWTPFLLPWARYYARTCLMSGSFLKNIFSDRHFICRIFNLIFRPLWVSNQMFPNKPSYILWLKDALCVTILSNVFSIRTWSSWVAKSRWTEMLWLLLQIL